jgi:hypothetical protein
MVAYAEQTETVRPIDTGATFNGNVRVWLFTNDPAEARACGAKLHELGLPLDLRLIQMPRVTGAFAINPNCRPHWDRRARRMVPEFLKYRQSPIILETKDSMDLQRFYKWLHAKNPNVTPAQPARPSLKDLADAGELDSFDAG